MLGKSVLPVGLLVILFSAGISSAAEPQVDFVKPARESRVGKNLMLDPAVRLKFMTNGLKLSEAQQEQVRTILDDESRQREAVKKDESLASEQVSVKIKEIAKDTHENIKKLLTPEQQAKFEYKYGQIQKRRENAMKANQQGAQGTSAK